MSKAAGTSAKIGWIGTGRMGYEMAARLGRGGCDVLAWNRTRAKAEPLGAYGVKIAGALSELAARDIVFTPGHGQTPKVFQRDGRGKIAGFIYLRGSHSLTFRRVG